MIPGSKKRKSFYFCFQFTFCCYSKCYGKQQLRGKIIFVTLLQLQSLLNGYQDTKVKLELETDVMEECSLLALWFSTSLFTALCSSCFIINPELPCLDMILSTKLNTNITQGWPQSWLASIWDLTNKASLMCISWSIFFT